MWWVTPSLKLKWDIIWTSGILHQSGLPHLPGVPYLYVNRPYVIIILLYLFQWNFTIMKSGYLDLTITPCVQSTWVGWWPLWPRANHWGKPPASMVWQEIQRVWGTAKNYPGSWPSWKFQVLHQIQVYKGNPVFIRKTKYISYFNTLVYSNIMFMDDCYGVQRKNILVCIPVCLVLGKRNVWRKLKRIMC